MAIEVEFTGDKQLLKHKSNVITYSYSEDSTPVIPGDSSGGVGALSFTAIDDNDSSFLFYGDDVNLSDDVNGSITGRIDSISSDENVINFNGVSSLIRLNIIRKVSYSKGHVGEIIEKILNTAGIYSGYSINSDIYGTPAKCPEYTGDLWVLLKQLSAVYDFEIALIDDVITFRKLRQATVDNLSNYSNNWSISGATKAQSISVNYYNYTDYSTEHCVYPTVSGWTEDTAIYQVDANKTFNVDLKLGVYLASVTQPEAADFVSKTNKTSVYSISGNDGIGIKAQQWTDAGGSLTVTIDENDSSILHLEIVGADLAQYSPFRVAVSAGTSDYYSSLRITGTGLGFEKKTISVSTGLTEDDTSNVVGATIDNVLISTIDQAYDAGRRAIVPYGMPKINYSFSSNRITNFVQSVKRFVSKFFFQYDASIGSVSFSTLDTSLGSSSFATLDKSLSSSVINNEPLQLFGNVAGARVRFRDSWFRTRSATITPTSVDVSTDWDTMFSDVNTINTGKTFTNFNGIFTNMTFTDFHLSPLKDA